MKEKCKTDRYELDTFRFTNKIGNTDGIVGEKIKISRDIFEAAE